MDSFRKTEFSADMDGESRLRMQNKGKASMTALEGQRFMQS